MDSIFSIQALPILVVCGIVLFLVFFKEKARFFFQMTKRAVIGSILIMSLNALFSYYSMDYFVGLNPITISVCALLGVPGVGLLYVLPLI